MTISSLICVCPSYLYQLVRSLCTLDGTNISSNYRFTLDHCVDDYFDDKEEITSRDYDGEGVLYVSSYIRDQHFIEPDANWQSANPHV